MTEETLEKLAQLLEQDQFELLIPEKIRTESGRISDKASASMDIPLVYLMNDAVESFLVFRNVRMTGGISQRLSGRTAGIHDQAGWQICACHKTG